MIEIRKSENSDQRYKHQLFINDALVEKVAVGIGSSRTGKSEPFIIVVIDYEVSKKLASHRFYELPPLESLQLRYKFDWSDFIGEVWATPSDDEQHYKITFSFGKFLAWKGAYSFAEYFDELSQIVKAANNPEIALSPSEGITEKLESRFPEYGSAVTFSFLPSELPIAKEIARCSEVLHKFHQEVERALASRLLSNSVAMSFDFPEEVRVPCEQYLLYFVQFLRDLGVSATSELKHEAGQVLFTVTPTDTGEALDKIRTALEIYMRLPSSPVSNLTSADSNIAIQRLVANIYHLKSQLALSQAMLQAKDATIQEQQFTISNQQRLLSDEVIIKSLRDITPQSREDKEELLGGTIAITKYKGKGFEINLPEIVRRLRKLFAEKV